MIGILDYGAGNIASVKNAMAYIGLDARTVSTADGIDSSDCLVFPGQGSFGSMMRILKERDIYDPLYDYINEKRPFLGICLGLQVLFEGSEEDPDISGYGILKGRATRFASGKVPQIGWNNIAPIPGTIKPGWAYYVNSYRIEASDCTMARSDYYGEFVAAIRKDNMTAFQFHPEKSGRYGLSLLNWWYNCLQKE